MKIEKKITYECILFDNGNVITFDHDQDCCEHNYADFSQLEDTVAMDTEFDENLMFEAFGEKGFRFGNPGKMFFVPCYSKQNVYYSTDIEIYYGNSKQTKEDTRVLYMYCEERIF